MALFNTDYLIPDSLHNIWFEIDEPIFVLFHNQNSQICKEFQRLVVEILGDSPKLKGVRVLQMECKEDLCCLPQDYKIFRLPCLISYDGEEKDRINSMVPLRELKSWMEN